MKRRKFIQKASALGAGSLILTPAALAQSNQTNFS